MNAYFGWVQVSGMPSIVHLSGRDIDNAVSKANGFVQKGIPTSKSRLKVQSWIKLQ
jgi:hypothetical protein